MPRTFLFNLPATAQTSLGTRIFYAELERLGNFLARLGGRPPAADEMMHLIRDYDSARRRLLEAASWCPPTRYAQAIRQFYWDGSCCFPDRSAEGNQVNGACVPLALVGGPVVADQLRLFDHIEDLGGRVVVNATEPGERTLGVSREPPGEALQAASESTPEVSLQSLLKLLAQRFSETCVDAFLRPNDRLYEWLRTRLATRKVRGILLHCYGGCDLWRAEAQTLRETFQLPLLFLEAESGGGPDRYQDRIEAFLEALR